MTQESTYKFCAACGHSLPGQAKFCPSCGVKVGSALESESQKQSGVTIPFPRKKEIFIAILVTLPLFGIGWKGQEWLSGEKPTVSYEKMLSEREGEDDSLSDPTLVRLREATKNFPDDISAWRTLAEALLFKLQSGDESKPPPKLVLETIDVLREILTRDENDQFALRSMADISLNQQVFNKAVEYFERYLKLVPLDDVARARYASALSFTGKSDQALKELNSILKKDPKNFYASAYLAVTYAQIGDKAKALQSGQTALKNAPSEEARARFSSFLESLDEEKAAPVENNPRGNTGGAPSPGASVLREYLQGHQIAGPKFAGMKKEGATVVLSFNDFPMEKMPPVIREKFVTAVKEKALADDKNTTKIIFVDSVSGAELHVASVP